MPAIGEMAPDFNAPTSTGPSLKLSSLRGGPVILYFYPAADTPGCTIEAKSFRDLGPQLAAKGVKVVGVSTDGVDAQCRFAEKYDLTFPLVADSSKEIARAYGVLKPSGTAKRVTFFLGSDGRVADLLDASSADAHVRRARALYLDGK